VARHNSDRDPW